MRYSLEALKSKIKQISLMYNINDFDLELLGDAMAVARETSEYCEKIAIKLPIGDYERLKTRAEMSRSPLVGNFECMRSRKFEDITFFRSDQKFTSFVHTERVNGLQCYTVDSDLKHMQIMRKIAAARKKAREARQSN